MKFNKIAILLIACISLSVKAQQFTITILYDNTLHNQSLEEDWGFSCLIEGGEKNVLFDTGTKADILFSNAKKLEKDLKNVDIIVLSHFHGDHIGGLDSVMTVNPNVIVYYPEPFPDKLKTNINARAKLSFPVTESVDICNRIRSTGILEDQIVEQSLILETEKGIVLITGCSHPGIIDIVRKTTTFMDSGIYLVFGGFHLLRHTDVQLSNIITAMKTLGVERCGATHCTGEHPIDMFREAFGEKFVEMGAGKILSF